MTHLAFSGLTILPQTYSITQNEDKTFVKKLLSSLNLVIANKNEKIIFISSNLNFRYLSYLMTHKTSYQYLYSLKK